MEHHKEKDPFKKGFVPISMAQKPSMSGKDKGLYVKV